MKSEQSGQSEKMPLHLRRTLSLALSAFLLALGGYIAFSLLRADPVRVTEKFTPFSRSALRLLAKMFSGGGFSVAELLLYLIAAVLAGLLVRLRWVLISGCEHRLRYLLRFVSVVLLMAVVLTELYFGLWGLNCFGQSLGEILGLSVTAPDAASLEALAGALAERANADAALSEETENYSFSELAEAVAEEWSAYTGCREPEVKYVLWSSGLSRLGRTGFLSVYTGEANVCRNAGTAVLAFSMSRETARRWGAARTAEADFMAFYVLRDAPNPMLRYSADLGALRCALKALEASDEAAVDRVKALCAEGVIRDLDAADGLQTSEKAAAVADKAEKALTSAADGDCSGDSTAALLLAWYRAEAS